jgi:hypothetical protein
VVFPRSPDGLDFPRPSSGSGNRPKALQSGFLQKLTENPPGVDGSLLFTTPEDFFETFAAGFFTLFFAIALPAKGNTPPDY